MTKPKLEINITGLDKDIQKTFTLLVRDYFNELLASYVRSQKLDRKSKSKV